MMADAYAGDAKDAAKAETYPRKYWHCRQHSGER